MKKKTKIVEITYVGDNAFLYDNVVISHKYVKEALATLIRAEMPKRLSKKKKYNVQINGKYNKIYTYQVSIA